ncbi:MAG: S8 family serine peptidase [Pseudomonadota bacterium]|nr:S8 family serine peptidase [Pseudomonadota bacterium]
MPKGVELARPAYAATQVGDVTSQGVAAMRADIGRTAFVVDGTGVMVGTLSDSYDCLGGAAAGVASGELPAGVTVLDELSPCTEATDEGRGMMEIIHDVAPGASQAFHTAFEGQASFAQGIIDLANAGAKLINDDVIYFAEPFYQDGIIAQAVDTVKGMGVAYFSSAGNEDRKAYESPLPCERRVFRHRLRAARGARFRSGCRCRYCQQITIPVGRTLTQVYQWDEPFFSVSGAPGSASDMDIVLTNVACEALVAGSAADNVGGDPFEVFGFTNGGPVTTFGVRILRLACPNPGLMKTVNVGSGSITIDQFDTKNGASWAHSAALGGLGVGAADYRDTPAFGRDLPLVETFSSAGGTPILFDTAGDRLATPEVRQQPDITAPDGADTSFFGSDTDGTGFPNFFGTSAAAPHAAGVAALMKDLVSTLTPDATYAALKATAMDMDDPSTGGFDTGFDFGTGFGLIQADAALGEVAPPPPPPPQPDLPPSPPITSHHQLRQFRYCPLTQRP